MDSGGRPQKVSLETESTFKTSPEKASPVDSSSQDDKDLTLIEAALREIFPHGHPSYITNALAKIKLHSTKNRDYALGGDPLGNFVRVSRFFAQYPGLSLSDPAVVAMTFMMKQIDASLWGLCQEHEMAEGIDDRWPDVVVYAGIIEILLKR